jgi:hypothetical protein
VEALTEATEDTYEIVVWLSISSILVLEYGQLCFSGQS